MMRRRKILVVWSGPENGTSANLFKTLVKALEGNHQVLVAPNGTITGSRLKKIFYHILCDLSRWPKVVMTDTVILHSYAALSLPTVLLARFLRRRIIVVLWDAYPITIDGKPLGGLYRKTFDRLEHFVVSLASRIVIPSEDFVVFAQHPEVRILPLWPSLPLEAATPRHSHCEGQPVRLAFVGQAGLTRGLPQAIARLGREAPTEFELHIFSPTPPDSDLADVSPNVRVVSRGYFDRPTMIAALQEIDFGLISLHPGMGQPGFPSKVFDYVAAGLPVIYIGRPLPAFGALLDRTGVGFALGDQTVDWLQAMSNAEIRMPISVQSFAAETELTSEKLEKAFFNLDVQ